MSSSPNGAAGFALRYGLQACSPSLQRPLSAGFDAALTAGAAAQLLGGWALTETGLPPVSRARLVWTHHLLGQSKREPPFDAGWAALCFALLMPATLALLFGGAAVFATHPYAAIIILFPFTFAGAFFAEVFRQRAADSARLYHADLAGAAAAALLVVPLISLTGPLHLVFLLAGIVAVGAALWSASQQNGAILRASLLVGLALFLCWPLSIQTNLLRLQPLRDPPGGVAKLMMRELADRAARPIVIDTEWTAYARTDFVRYPLPEQEAYSLHLFTDGETPSNMTPFRGRLDQVSYLRGDLPYLAFDLSPHQRLLSIGPGAGLDFLWGLLAGFQRLDGVEINDSVVHLMERYRKVNGDLYHYPGVRVTVEDGRSFVRRSQDQYDLIANSLTQTATTGNLGLSLVESYIHTKEAFAEYYEHLTPSGRYALVADYYPVLLRGALTAIAVMEDQGLPAPDACRRLMVLSLPDGERAPTPYRYLLVWKKSPLTPEDLEPARRATAAGAVVPLYLPGSGGNSLLAQIERGELTTDRLFSRGLSVGDLRLDLRPATDDRPFFLDPSPDLPRMLKWFLVVTLVIAVAYSAAFLSRRRAAGKPLRRWVIYFSALGVGFMMVEIPLIQKLILSLGHPTVSLAAVLFYLLLGASLGSRMSHAWSLDSLPRRAAVFSLLAALLVAVYVFSLSPLITLLQPWPRLARLLILAVFVSPVGICLGVPFPSGLRLMAGRWDSDIPWMWGVNGMMSVVGSVAAVAGAKLIGFNACLSLGGAIYVAVALGLLRFGGGGEPPAAPADTRPRRRPGAADSDMPSKRPPTILLVGLLAVAGAALVWAVLLRPGARTGDNALALGGITSDWTPLHRAAFGGDTEAVDAILSAGVPVDVVSQSALGWTPLHEAAFVGHPDLVGHLISRGAKVGTGTARGRTALHLAAWLGHADIAKILLEHGADPNARDRVGWTPLHDAAVMQGSADLAKLLLSKGADIKARDNEGRTPLHLAAWMGKVDVVALLLASGAEADARDEEGLTPLALAKQRGNTEIVRLLSGEE